jgi:hypothetical protein
MGRADTELIPREGWGKPEGLDESWWHGCGFRGGAGYGKVKAALGCFDERRLLLEPNQAEHVSRGFWRTAQRISKLRNSMGAWLSGLA